MRNVIRVSLVALKRALGVMENANLGMGGQPEGDWRRAPLNLL